MAETKQATEKISWFKGIQAKVILQFLPIILLVPLFLAVVTYYGQRQSIISGAQEHLTSVVTLKSHALEDYFQGGRDSLSILSGNEEFKNLTLLNSTGKKADRVKKQVLASLRALLKAAIRNEPTLDELFIVDSIDGRVLVSTSWESKGKIYKDHTFFREGLKHDFTDRIQILPANTKPVVYSAVPIAGYTGKPLAVLVGRHNFEPVNDLMEELSGLGDTGDTYLFNEYFLYLTKPRAKKRSVVMREAVFTDAAKRARETGEGVGIYNNEKKSMIGSFLFLNNLGTGLIAEETLNEILTSLNDLKNNLAGATLLVTIFALFALWFISRKIVKPLSQLSRVVTNFSAGNFSTRSEIQSQDEIGRLSQNFNHMATSLEKLYGSLEDQVKKRTEELVNSLLETEEARAEWEDTFHAMSDSLFIYDEKELVRRLNKSAEDMIQKNEAEVRGYSLDSILPVLPAKTESGDYPSIVEVTDEQNNQIYRIQHFVKHNAKAVPQGGVLVYRNITDERRREEEYQGVQTQLIEASKLAAVGTLSAGVAHEFNNLIAGIRLHSDLALEFKTPDKMEKALKIAIESSERAAKIVSSLLVFSRRKSSEKEPENLQDVMEETLGLVEADYVSRGIQVIKKFDDLPLVPIDRGQISQVVLNLLTNARDAVLKRKDPKIEIKLSCRNEWVFVEIADNGQGIKTENIKKIFEPFFTTKGLLGGGAESTPGTGLGLSISYGIIQSHGGSIDVQSKPGKGTHFIIKLPVAGVKQEKPTDSSASQPAPQEHKGVNQEVLVIDDEEHIRKALKESLEGMGHKVWVAKDGNEGLEMIKQLHPDLMFIDILMPGLSGTELIQEVHKSGKTSKIVAMSGAVLEDENLLYQMGVKSILKKPFKVSELHETFYQVVNA